MAEDLIQAGFGTETCTALHVACLRDKAKMVDVMLRQDGVPDHKDTHGAAALYIANSHGNPGIVQKPD